MCKFCPSLLAQLGSIPENLENVLAEIDLPIDYHQLRKAMLYSESDFWQNCILRDALNCKKISYGNWDQHAKSIGLPSKDIAESKFIGAKRKSKYLLPKSGLISANMAYETTVLTEYNDNCFALKRSTTTPDLPFGDKFVAQTKVVVINSGKNKSRMICSVEPEFNGGQAFVCKQIKRGMLKESKEAFNKMGKAIRMNTKCILM